MQVFLPHEYITNMMKCGGMCMVLTDCKRGDTVEIVEIKDDWAREQVIRFGLVKGVKIACQYKTNGGPVVIKRGNQNIAIGHQVASKISVKRKWR